MRIFLDPMRHIKLFIHNRSRYQAVLKGNNLDSGSYEILMIKNVQVLNQFELKLIEIGDDQIFKVVNTDDLMSNSSRVLLKPLIEGALISYSFENETEVLENVLAMHEAWIFEKRRLSYEIPARSLRLTVLSTWFRSRNRNEILLQPFSGPLCEESDPMFLVSNNLQDTNNDDDNDNDEDSDCDSVSGTFLVHRKILLKNLQILQIEYDEILFWMMKLDVKMTALMSQCLIVKTVLSLSSYDENLSQSVNKLQ